MPILFMALIALAVFLVMGGMVFYAAWAEARTPHKDGYGRGVQAGATPGVARDESSGHCKM